MAFCFELFKCYILKKKQESCWLKQELIGMEGGKLLWKAFRPQWISTDFMKNTE